MRETTYREDDPPPKASGDHARDLPRVWLTWVLLTANVLVYAAMAVVTQNPLSFPVKDLLAWGGNFAPGIYQGEFWRPLTSMFLHAGIIHLGMNMWVLSIIGPFMERLLGITGFLLLYLLAGFAGNVLGMMWHAHTVGVGASGAIFGLYGGLLGFLLVRHKQIPADALRPLLNNGLYFLGINVVLGFTVPGVDVAAHLLGAGAGLVGGIVASWPVARSPQWAWIIRNALLAALCAAVVAVTPLCIPASAKAHAHYLDALRSFRDKEEVLLGRYNALVGKDHDEVDNTSFATRLERDVLEPWSNMRQRFPPLEDLPRQIRDAPAVPLIYDYLAATEESFRLLAQANRNGDQELGLQATARLRKAEELVAQLRQLAADK